MEVREQSNIISRLKRMRGDYRIWKENPISNIILSVEYDEFPGVGHEFLESRFYETEEGEWIEHYWLLRSHKLLDLSTTLKMISKVIKSVEGKENWKEVERVALEDIDSTDPEHYYFLVSIISDGKEKEKRNYTHSLL